MPRLRAKAHNTAATTAPASNDNSNPNHNVGSDDGSNDKNRQENWYTVCTIAAARQQREWRQQYSISNGDSTNPAANHCGSQWRRHLSPTLSQQWQARGDRSTRKIPRREAPLRLLCNLLSLECQLWTVPIKTTSSHRCHHHRLQRSTATSPTLRPNTVPLPACRKRSEQQN